MGVETIDDSDPRIQYADAWVVSGIAQEYNNTSHGVGTGTGSAATLSFFGTSISMYGTVPSLDWTITSTYTLDNGTPFSSVTQISDQKLFHHLFYTSPTLPNGHHTLVVNAGYPIWLDYFLVTSDPDLSDPPVRPPVQNTSTSSTSVSHKPTGVSAKDNFTASTPIISKSTSESDSALKSSTAPQSINSTLTSQDTHTLLPTPLTQTPVTQTPLTQTPLTHTLSTLPSTTSTPHIPPPGSLLEKHLPKGLIIGSTVGGVVAALLIFLIIWRWRKNRYSAKRAAVLPRSASFMKGRIRIPDCEVTNVDSDPFADSNESLEHGSRAPSPEFVPDSSTEDIENPIDDGASDLTPPRMPQAMNDPFYIDPDPFRVSVGPFHKVRSTSFATQSSGPPAYMP